MGWETNCKAEVRFNKETYNSIYDVQSKQEEATRLINHMRDELLIMAASDPKLLIQKDCEGIELDITQSIRHKLDEVLELMQESLVDKFKLECLEESWHTRVGDFVKNDIYATYIGPSRFGLKTGRIYGVNKHKTWHDKTEYIVITDDWNPLFMNEDDYKNLFKESTYDEWYNQPSEWELEQQNKE